MSHQPPGSSSGTLLGGRVAYSQMLDGYRTGLEPILLAAAVPARDGDDVLEAGTGAGAGLLALTARVPGVRGVGLEIDPELARLASANFAANGHEGLQALAEDVTHWPSASSFDHAFANPPWHAAAGTPSVNAQRRRAKVASAGLLAIWAQALARSLRPRGTLSLILPASQMGEAMHALREADCPQICLFPLWKRAGEPARLVILQATRLGRGPCRMLPGMVLHAADGRLSEAAEIILRGAGGLALQPSAGRG